ncbi:unnamed protein product [Pieris macdunnoughi]|uniref:Endonuclease-reverse transcriptase n=1 Tax=Pieris macdunnoughi TaxID=345717 RepID=A0A821VK34_9NEOP|nr:unnamed protein product [Pieris macdunnoughi]
MNTEKTKVMTNSIKTEIKVNGKILEYVEEYVYLGQIISHEDQMFKEIHKRIANGWRKYWAMKEIMKSKAMNIGLKKKVFNTCILPCVTYGCETWSLTQLHRKKLSTFQHAVERSMLGIKRKDKIRNTDIRRRTKLTDILIRIDQQKWRWTGHLMRSSSSSKNKWSNIVTHWYPRNGKRSRGRQYRRWEDELKLTAGPNWRRVALDRTQWKELEEAFAERHTVIRDIL